VPHALEIERAVAPPKDSKIDYDHLSQYESGKESSDESTSSTTNSSSSELHTCILLASVNLIFKYLQQASNCGKNDWDGIYWLLLNLLLANISLLFSFAIILT